MHFTLGVMSLSTTGNHTIQTALNLLSELKPLLDGLTATADLEVSLETMGVFSKGRSRNNSNVLWVGPHPSGELSPSFEVLRSVSGRPYIIMRSFTFKQFGRACPPKIQRPRLYCRRSTSQGAVYLIFGSHYSIFNHRSFIAH